MKVVYLNANHTRKHKHLIDIVRHIDNGPYLCDHFWGLLILLDQSPAEGCKIIFLSDWGMRVRSGGSWSVECCGGGGVKSKDPLPPSMNRMTDTGKKLFAKSQMGTSKF